MDDGKELIEIDRALAEALAVDVSPDFAARVRRRIATQPVPSPFWQSWRDAAPAAAAVLVVAAVAVVTLPTHRSIAPPLLAARPLALDSSRPPQGRPVPPVGGAVTRRSTPAVRTAAVAMVAAGPQPPDVLVPREEIEMYRRLIATAQRVSGAMLVEPPPDIVAAGSISEIPIDRIKIDLIIPSVDGEGDRQ